MKCFECENEAQCMHHVVPRALAGTKVVPLCLKCHGKIHGIKFSDLIKLGQKKSLKKPGRPKKLTYDQECLLWLDFREYMSYRKIAEKWNISKSVVHEICVQFENQAATWGHRRPERYKTCLVR